MGYGFGFGGEELIQPQSLSRPPNPGIIQVGVEALSPKFTTRPLLRTRQRDAFWAWASAALRSAACHLASMGAVDNLSTGLGLAAHHF